MNPKLAAKRDKLVKSFDDHVQAFNAHQIYEQAVLDVIELLSTFNQEDEVKALKEAQWCGYSHRTPVGRFVDGAAYMHAEILAKLKDGKKS